ncbi:unnamed protein product [Sphagnum tenellum]
MAFTSINVLLLGKRFTGKTSLVNRLFGRELGETYKPTLTPEVHPEPFVLQIKGKSGGEVHFDIKDTSGREDLATLKELDSEKAHGAIVLSDITSPMTIAKLQEWRDIFGIPVVGAANKHDHLKRPLHEEYPDQWTDTESEEDNSQDEDMEKKVEEEHKGKEKEEEEDKEKKGDNDEYDIIEISVKSNISLDAPFILLAKRVTGNKDLRFLPVAALKSDDDLGGMTFDEQQALGQESRYDVLEHMERMDSSFQLAKLVEGKDPPAN